MTDHVRRRGGLSKWEGRVFLSVGRALYWGSAGDTTPHAHHALQLCIGLEAPVRLRGPNGRWGDYDAAVVPADVAHRLDGGGGPVLLLYVEPESEDGHHWLPEVRRTIRGLDRRTVSAVRDCVHELATARCADLGVEGVFANLLRSVGLRPDARVPADPRVAEVVRRLRTSPGLPLSPRHLAHEVALSPSRFRHLFRREIGMSLQSYIVWLRIYHACTALARGATLSVAAFEAGFSDAPHFTRTFRRTFGIAPSQVAARLEMMLALDPQAQALTSSEPSGALGRSSTTR